MERGLLREQEYDAESAERASLRPTRRGLGRMGAAALGAGALTRLGRPRAAAAAEPPIVKPIPADLFVPRGTNAEMRWSAMSGEGYLTPADRFFVRNHTSTPRIDLAGWRLRIHGTGVQREVTLSYDDLLALPTVTVTRAVECAGNGRSYFGSQQGQPAAGTTWGLGAIGVATWTGVPLSAVLERAGLTTAALDVMPVGLDTVAVRRPIPVEKALEHDTLLVLAMNGDVLPPDHGFPVRLLVPGWVGVSNVKWVGSIEVSETPLLSQWNTTSYRLFGPAYPDSPLVTTQVVKSALEHDDPVTLQRGPRRLTGRSWSGEGRIRRVEVAVDDGPWLPAHLERRNDVRAWRQWSLPWNARPGAHTVRVRAHDDRGNVQPESVPFNEQGYLFGAVVAQRVTVA